jgi:hypothetical protein
MYHTLLPTKTAPLSKQQHGFDWPGLFIIKQAAAEPISVPQGLIKDNIISSSLLYGLTMDKSNSYYRLDNKQISSQFC